MTAILSLLITSTLLFSFQNCGKAGFDTASMENASLNVNQDPKVEATPFAFNVGFDTISYSSCYGPKAANLFSFKVSANVNQGIKVNKTFHEYALKNIDPVYNPENPSDTSIKPHQIKNLIVESPVNKDVYPRLSMVARGNVGYSFSSSGTPVVGTDIINLLGNLSDDRYLETLVSNIENNVQHFPLIPNNALNMESDLVGELKYNEDSQQVSLVRQSFYIPNADNKTSMIAATFSRLGDDKPISPGSDLTKAYGIGYQLMFDVYRDFSSQSVHPNNPQNVLLATGGITEIDLATNAKIVSNWDCSLRFKVVRKKDRNGIGNCPVEPITSINLNELQIARRHLPEDIWDINTSNNCVVLKNEVGTNTYAENTSAQQMSCYGDEVQTINNQVKNEVQYDPTAECFNPENPNPAILPICAQYISICTKVQ